MIFKNNIYSKIKKHLSKTQFFQFNLFIFFSIIAMLLEMIGISLIIPIINIFTQDQITFSKFVFSGKQSVILSYTPNIFIPLL